MPTVNYRAERTCCDDDRPVHLGTTDPAHFHKGTGVYLRSECCGKIHWAERSGTNEQ